MLDGTHADRIEVTLEPGADELGRCDEMDILESAIVLQQRLRIKLKGADEELLITPTDLETRDGAEYLHYKLDLERQSTDINQIESIEVFEVE